MPIVGLGTDIVEIERISGSRQQAALAKRVLTPAELEQMQQSAQPGRFLAKRWAAKEAAAKALGTGIAQGISFQHFEVSHAASGQPLLHFSQQAKLRAEALGVTSAHISISDERHYALATVVLESGHPTGENN